MKKIIQYTFYPFMLVMSILLPLYLFEMLAYQWFFLIPLIISILTIIITVVLEFYMPHHKEWLQNKGDQTSDFIQTLIVLPFFAKLAEILVLSGIGYLLISFPFGWAQINLQPYGGWMLHFVVIVLTSELMFYFAHRIFHRWALLWKFHVIHHGAQRVYWLNSGRFHFIEAFFASFFYFLPFLIFKPTTELVVLLISLSAVSGFLEHVNIQFKAGVLNYIFNTADLHRWHHSQNIEKSNKNFGKVLILWDHVFGTYYWPGKSNLEVGVEGHEVPNNFWKQNLYPWRKD